MAILSAIAGILGLGSTIYGAVKGAQANREADVSLRRQHQEERAERNRLLMRGAVNDSQNQQLLRKLQEMQRLSYDRARATNVVAGGTDASLAAMQQNNAQVTADVMGDMAARSSAREDALRREGIASEKQYANQQAALKQQRAQNIAQAAGQATKAAAGIAAASGSASNPFGLETGRYAGLTQAEAEAVAKGNIDATTAASIAEQEAEYKKILNNVPVFGRL